MGIMKIVSGNCRAVKGFCESGVLGESGLAIACPLGML